MDTNFQAPIAKQNNPVSPVKYFLENFKENFFSIVKKLIKPPFSFIGGGVIVIILFLFVLGILSKPKSLHVDTTPQDYSLKLWSFSENADHYKKLIDAYELANPHIKVIFEQRQNSDYRSVINQRITDGVNMPDIFEVNNSEINFYLGYILPSPTDIINYSDFNKAYYPQAIIDNSNSGNVYGLPTGIDGLMLVYNKDLVKDTELPKYWSDLVNLSNAKTKANGSDETKNDKNGIAAASDEKMLYLDEIAQLLIFQNRQKSFYDDTLQVNIKPTLGQDAINQFIKLIEKRPWDISTDDSLQAFIKGNTAYGIVKAKDIYDIQSKNPSLKFGTAIMPVLVDQVHLASYTSFVVSNQTSSQTEAWKLMKYLTNEDSVKYLSGSATDFKLSKKPSPFISQSMDVKNDPVYSPIAAMAPNMVNWESVNSVETNKVFKTFMITSAIPGNSITEDNISNLNINLNAVLGGF